MDDRLPDRIQDKISPDPNSGCWLWTAHTITGYGRISIKGKGRTAHRVIYELLVGPIPVGLQLDHLCRVRCCVNPQHLDPVTPRENTMRGIGPGAINAKKTHCKRGHPFSGKNLHVRPNGDRLCLACSKAHCQSYRDRKKARETAKMAQ